MEAVFWGCGHATVAEPGQTYQRHNGWYRRLNDFIVGFSFVCFGRCLIEPPPADVNGVCQKLVYVANAEAIVPASPISANIQPFDYFFNAKRA